MFFPLLPVLLAVAYLTLEQQWEAKTKPKPPKEMPCVRPRLKNSINGGWTRFDTTHFSFRNQLPCQERHQAYLVMPMYILREIQYFDLQNQKNL